MNFRDVYEFDPETYSGGGGGLPGTPRRFMQQQSQQQQEVDFDSNAEAGREYNPETSFNPQGGLLGRLLSLQAEQSRYQPNGGQAQAPFAPRDPNFRQLPQVSNGAPRPMPVSPASQAEASAPLTQAEYEADQAAACQRSRTRATGARSEERFPYRSSFA